MQHASTRRAWLLAGLLCLLCVLSPGAVAADTGHITVEPAAQTIAAGSIATVSIQMGAGAPVYGVEVHLSFDPTLLEVVDEDSAKNGVQVKPGTLFAGKQTFTVMNTADNTAGTVDYVVTLMGEPHAVEEGGSIIVVGFRGRANGQATVAIARAVAGDQAARLIEVVTQDGSVTVQGGSNAAATPTTTVTPSPAATGTLAGIAATLAPTATTEPGTSPASAEQPAENPTPTAAGATPTIAETSPGAPAQNTQDTPTPGTAGGVDPGATVAVPTQPSSGTGAASSGTGMPVGRSPSRWLVAVLAIALICLIAVFAGLYLWLGRRRPGQPGTRPEPGA